MSLLYLSDILIRLKDEIPDLDFKRVKLFRHSLNNAIFLKCFEDDKVNEYQQLQKKGYYDKCDYVLTFISGPSTSAKFIGLYKVVDSIGVKASDFVLEDILGTTEFSDKTSTYNFKLEKMNNMAYLESRLIIDWGKATRQWGQWATNDKEIIAIHESEKFTFRGYESLLLDYRTLKTILSDNVLYESWHSALESVSAIYMIMDQVTGKMYVGSAYGDGGLLQRWRCYVQTLHGGNKKMIELLNEDSLRYESFQFTILQIIPKTYTVQDVVSLENLYKEKFKTRTFGLNDN